MKTWNLIDHVSDHKKSDLAQQCGIFLVLRAGESWRQEELCLPPKEEPLLPPAQAPVPWMYSQPMPRSGHS